MKPLCPQEYDGLDMRVVVCTRCRSGWDKALGKCSIDTGVEHFPVSNQIPECPIQDWCQHQLQSTDGPCSVRARGMVCESAFVYVGLPVDQWISFSASTAATAEDLMEVDSE